MKKNSWIAIAFTTVSALAFVFVFSSIYFLRSTVLLQVLFPGYFDTTVQSGQDILQNRNEVVIDDPLITVVPTDQQSEVRKTKVFISSLDPILGYSSAKVLVIVFGDPTDSVTQDYIGYFQELSTSYGDDVAFVWKDGSDSVETEFIRNIAHCSNEQNLFWEFMTAYVDNPTTDETALVDLARGVGVEPITLQDCVSSREYNALGTQEANYAKAVGATNTHAVFINDQLYNDQMTIDDLRGRIEATLAEYDEATE